MTRLQARAYEQAGMNWQAAGWTFSFGGREIPYFFHRHNCGWPPMRCTERSIELALADQWLSDNADRNVCEVGAVTPYYWPSRVTTVIDPADAHVGVTHKQSLFDADLAGHSLLSISTIEHVGLEEYGLEESQPASAGDALLKIADEVTSYLITVPMGYNAPLDAILRAGPPVSSMRFRFLTRETSVRWREVHSLDGVNTSYGPKWANTLAVIGRGAPFF